MSLPALFLESQGRFTIKSNDSWFGVDDQIVAWNPENRDLDPKVVGKNLHLETLLKAIGVRAGSRGKEELGEIILLSDLGFVAKGEEARNGTF